MCTHAASFSKAMSRDPDETLALLQKLYRKTSRFGDEKSLPKPAYSGGAWQPPAPILVPSL
jgi:hypothetical protein